MDTPEKGASTASADSSETSQTDTTDENANGGTSDGGTHEDADDVETLKKRNADKDAHISRLEGELQAAKAGKKPASETAEDVTDWKILNADAIRICGKEYQDEVAFLKSQGVKMTPAVLERALQNAKARKGLSKPDSTEATRQAETASPSQGEHRQTSRRKPVLTDQQRAMGLTEDDVERYGKQIEAEKKEMGA